MIIIWFRSKTSQFNTMALVSTSIIWSVYQVLKIKYLYTCVCTAKKNHNKIWQIFVPLISFLKKRKTVSDSYCLESVRKCLWITRRDLSKLSCCGLLLILLLIRKCLEVCPNLFNIKIHVLSIYKYKRLYMRYLKKIWTCLYLINRIYLKVAYGMNQ